MCQGKSEDNFPHQISNGSRVAYVPPCQERKISGYWILEYDQNTIIILECK